MRYAKLIKVEAGENNNKFYEMSEQSDKTFSVKFGRVGVSSQSVTYPMSKWQSKYNEKVKKGYRDITELMVVSEEAEVTLTGDAKVDQLLIKLIKASKEEFSKTYNASATAITQAQVAEVQRLINKINTLPTVEETHRPFQEIWMVIPRWMSNVNAYLPRTLDEVKRQLGVEQDAIDNANVQRAFVSTDENKTLIENLGIKIERLTDIPSDLAKLLDGNSVTAFYKLSKPAIDDRFKSFIETASDKTTALRFHGTRWKNGMAILNAGLRILGSKSSTYSGSMLGDAIYTSRDFGKSRNYSDGLMLVLTIHQGKPLYVKELKDVRNYSYDELVKLGYHSVNADPGIHTGWAVLQRHEQTIYHEHQHRFEYLLEWQ